MDPCFSLFCEQSYQTTAPQLSNSPLIAGVGSVHISLDSLVSVIMMQDIGKSLNCKRMGSAYGQLREMDGQVATWKSGRSPARGEGAGSSHSHLSPFFLTLLLSFPTSLPGAEQLHCYGGKVRSCKETWKSVLILMLMKSLWKPLFLSQVWASHHCLTLIIRGKPPANKLS